MKSQFEVWRFPFPEKGEHPVLFITRPLGRAVRLPTGDAGHLP